ncbi:MAG: DUF655 domain-containing protein [Halobacteriales archaeon]
MSDAPTGEAVVLDVLAHGRSDDDRPRYRREPVAYAMGVGDFQLYELGFESTPDVAIGERIDLDADDAPATVRPVDSDGLSSGARAELEYVVEEIVDEDRDRFLTFFNESQPISLRLHQLNLLPGIGEKLREAIIEARRRGPFADFDELEERVNGLHDPRSILIERILEELHDPDLKYYLFVGSDALWTRQNLE